MPIEIIEHNFIPRMAADGPNISWILGNTGDWLSEFITFRVAFEKVISPQNAIQLLPNNVIKNEDGQSWSNYGFAVGDVITLDVNGNSPLSTPWTYSLTGRTITWLSGDEMRVDGSDITIVPPPALGLNMSGAFNRIPFQNGENNTQQTVKISVEKTPQSISIKHALVLNSESQSASLSSLIDGTQTEYLVNNVDTFIPYNSVPMLPVGMRSGAACYNATCRLESASSLGGYIYRIAIAYMIPTIYEDITNLINMRAPDWLYNTESITSNFEISAFPTFNNPNLKVSSNKTQTAKLGNIGWFNENFNGLQNDFHVKSVEYIDTFTNNQVSGLSYSSPTKVKALIGGVQNLDNSLSPFLYGFAWCPENADYYKNKNSPLHENLLVNTAGAYASGVFYLSNSFSPMLFTGFSANPSMRMDCSNVRFSKVGNDVLFEATFEPTLGFKDFMSSVDEMERNYILWVSCMDRLKVGNQSNKVNLMLDFNKLQIYVPTAGEWRPLNIDFYEHPNNGTEDLSQNCGTDFIVEDDLLARVDFSIYENGQIPQSIEFVIQARNFTNDNTFVLDSYTVNLQGYPTSSNGLPIYDFEATRGFKYGAGNNKNLVKVSRNSSADTLTSFGYTALFGFKIRWEDWILKGGVPSDFYNPSEKNNGFNNDWYQYQNTPNWKVEFAVKIVANDGQTLVQYINTKDMPIRDYLQNPNISSVWNFYRNSDNYLLNAGTDPITGRPLGIVLEEEETRLEVLFTRQSGIWTNLNNVYATIGLEVENGSGQFDFRQISSIWQSENDNPLKPLQGESLLKLTLINPTTVKAECLINPNYLPIAPRLKHSARIGCKLL